MDLTKITKENAPGLCITLLRSLLNNTVWNCYRNWTKCLLCYLILLIKFHNGHVVTIDWNKIEIFGSKSWAEA